MQIRCHPKHLCLGAGLLIYTLLCPSFLTAQRLGIYHSLYTALQTDSTPLLYLAAFKIVLLNCLRSVPNYLGTFILTESLDVRYKTHSCAPVVRLLPLFIIPLIYYVMEPLYGIRYDFGTPAALLVIYVVILTYLNLFSVNLIQKALTLTMPFVGIQFLDLVPALSSYGFGNGEISSDIKAAALVMGRAGELSILAGALFCAVVLCSLINLQTLIQAHSIRTASRERQHMQEELYQTKLEALRLRSAGEVQSLVHDLRTPLTTIQGLVGLAEMMEENPLIAEYLQRILKASETMNVMISDILYEDRRSTVTVQAFLHQICSSTSSFLSPEVLKVEDGCPQARISINRISMVRAVVNLLDNSRKAIDPERGRITLRTTQAQGQVHIRVEDNGAGMTREQLGHAFDLGWSGKGSTGLGLNYVRQVVERQDGTITMDSHPGTGTTVEISLKEA